MIKYLFILSISLILLSSCSNLEKKRQVASIIEQWIGKEILYPEETVFTVQDGDTLDNVLLKEYSYTIVNYVDSTGCTSCKLQLPRWNTFIQEIDSISKKKINLCFIFHPQDIQEVINVLKVNSFKYPIWIDKDDSFNKLNHLSSNMSFQTFLLDKNNKVVSIGNPIYNLKVKKLYMDIIQGKTDLKEDAIVQTKIKVQEQSISLGRFDWKEEQKVKFTIQNIGEHPLIISDVTTSCGCTSVDYSKEPVRPGESITLQVTYKADYPEHFDKTITVYCNANPSLIHLKIIGDAE